MRLALSRNNASQIIMRYLSLLATFIFFSNQGYATEYYFFNLHSSQCVLQKYVNNTWVDVLDPDREIGNLLVDIQPSAENPQHSNFKYNETLYTASTTCFVKKYFNVTHPEPPPPPKPFTLSPLFIESTASYSVMTGSGTSAETVNGVTSNRYSPNIGINGRVGYRLDERNGVYGEFKYFSGAMNFTAPVNTTEQDKILNFDVGYQRYFLENPLRLFFGVAAGYSSWSANVTAASLDLNESLGASSFNAVGEIGVIYKLVKNFSATANCAYTYLNISHGTVDSTNNSSHSVGESVSNSINFSHIDLNVGFRYDFR